MAAEETTPEPRRIIVDVTLQLEVLVDYLPEGDGGDVSVRDVAPVWDKLQIGLAYWQPLERQTVFGIRSDIHDYITRNMPQRLELRWRHD